MAAPTAQQSAEEKKEKLKLKQPRQSGKAGLRQSSKSGGGRISDRTDSSAVG